MHLVFNGVVLPLSEQQQLIPVSIPEVPIKGLLKSYTYFQTKRNRKREITTSKTAPITGPTIISISMSLLSTLIWPSGSLVGANGFGLSGNFPNGAGRMSREIYSEKGDDVYKCWQGKRTH